MPFFNDVYLKDKKEDESFYITKLKNYGGVVDEETKKTEENGYWFIAPNGKIRYTTDAMVKMLLDAKYNLNGEQ